MSSLILTIQQAGYKKPFLCIPDCGTIAQVCGFSLALELGLLSEHPLCLLELAHGMHSGVHTRSWQMSRGRCRFGTWGIGGAHMLLRGSSSGTPRGLWVNFLLKSWSIHEEMHFFNDLWYSYLLAFLSLCSFQSSRSHFRNVGASGEKWFVVKPTLLW